MQIAIKPLLTALLLAGLGGGAQAAYLDYMDHLGFGAYSAVTNGAMVDDALLDLSVPPSDLTFFGAHTYNTPIGDGALDHSYAADAFIVFSAAGADLSMSVSQSLAATANSALVGVNHQQDAGVDLSAVRLQVMGGVGEAVGSAMTISFTGHATAFVNYGSVVSGGYLTMGLSVSRGSDVLDEFLWDVQASGDQPIGLSFSAVVGDELTFSAFALAGATLADAAFSGSAAPYVLVDSLGAMNGSFAVAAVPEPESLAMLLAGLGVLGFQVRRRRQQGR